MLTPMKSDVTERTRLLVMTSGTTPAPESDKTGSELEGEEEEEEEAEEPAAVAVEVGQGTILNG